ncbi:HTH-type transcriptional regulator GltC [Pigmentiphaga humi]|uniref:HTH-type transcriptional regulator GltC n=1 Tax=Pigmentiphaga humi TaxID=2478468 RepID=A0A3P4B2Z8_9BURK|nr:LysR family transcriptional regulator [Pigmentiphaga humi]VCU70008.1 HTH-type transcriptional regulator GltC [Pigmentiphaga humi]
MNVTLRQLRAYVEVVHCGGFTAASKRLHLTQSATSLLVRELEGQLGLQLLDRSTRKLAMTEAGQEFLQSAERILGDVELAVNHVQDRLEKRRGRLTVATTPVMAATLLPEVIASFQQAHPAISVRLADCPIDEIIRQVQDGEADFGVGVFTGIEADLQRTPLMRHALGAMIPQGWPLARRRRDIAWADLADQPMIVVPQSSGSLPQIDRVLHQSGIAAKPRFEVRYIWSALGLVEAGLGIAVVPSYAKLALRPRRARFRMLHDPVVHRKIELVTQTGRSMSPAAEAFREHLAARCRQLQE